MMIEAAVLAAAYASPDDVQARLRYADRLAAQAQTEDQRAIPELIRAELRLENLPEGEPERRPLEERVTELTLPALRGWKALLGGVATVAKFRRGLPESVVFDVRDFLRHGESLAPLLPAWRVRLEHAGRHARALADCAHLRAVRDLNLRDTGIADEAVATLAGSPHVGGLRRLDLWGNRIGNAGARALLHPESLPSGLRLVLDPRRISYALRQALRQRFDLWQSR